MDGEVCANGSCLRDRRGKNFHRREECCKQIHIDRVVAESSIHKHPVDGRASDDQVGREILLNDQIKDQLVIGYDVVVEG